MIKTAVRMFFVVSCIFSLLACAHAYEEDDGALTVIKGPLYKVFRGGKWGFIDSTGKIVIRAEYDTATDFHEGKAYVTAGNLKFILDQGDGKFTPIQQEIIIPFKEGRAFTRSAGYSMINEKGEVMISRLSDVTPFSDGWARVRISENSPDFDKEYPYPVFIDREGAIVMDIRDTLHNEKAQRSSNAGATEEPTTAWPFASGLSRIYLNHEIWAYIDKKGKVVIPAKYERAYDFCDGLARVMLGGKWGFIDTDGKPVVDCIYEDAMDFSDGLAAVKSGGKWGFVNTRGKVAISPSLDEPSTFMEGMAIIARDGKFGFMDKTGRIAIEPVYGALRDFRDGLAMFYKGTLNGYIDKTGKIVYSYDTMFAE